MDNEPRVEESRRSTIDQAWAMEVEARLQAYARGEIDTIPGEEVFESLKSRSTQHRRGRLREE